METDSPGAETKRTLN